VAITGGTVHPVAGPAIARGTVLFEDGVILAVGRTADVTVPADAQRVDATGRHVWPGGFDAFSHLGLIGFSSERAGLDLDEHGTMNPNARAEVALEASSWHFGTARACGVLLVATVPRGDLVPGTSAVIALDGWTSEEMVRRAPAGLVIVWPNLRGGNPDDVAKHDEEVARLDDMIEQARAYVEAVDRDAVPRDIDVRWESLRPVLGGETAVWISARTVLEIHAALDWTSRHGLRMVLVDGDSGSCGDAHLCAKELAARDVPVILKPTRRPRRADRPYDEAYAQAGLLHAAGVRVAVGTWSAMMSRRAPEQAGQAAAYGLPRAAAERAVTLEAARILGVDDRYGSLEVGKSATLLIVEGDLLDVRGIVRRAWIDGREISLENRHTELRDRWAARPR
jgi:imidazolonepropionase-like amidohydrolase